jgi:hypothetical protein
MWVACLMLADATFLVEMLAPYKGRVFDPCEKSLLDIPTPTPPKAAGDFEMTTARS